jgi:hypothetical protein
VHGTGWIVVVASFFIHVFAVGIAYIFGIFVDPLQKQFGASRASVSWISSVASGVVLASSGGDHQLSITHTAVIVR